MEIYVDVVILLNILMNSCILLLTGWIAGIRRCIWRIILAAAFGSFYSVACLLPELAVFYAPLSKLIAALFIIVLAYGYRSVKVTVIFTLIFYMVSFFLGGAVLGWIFFWQVEGSQLLENVSVGSLIAGCGIGILVLNIIFRALMSRLHQRKNTYEIEIIFHGRSVRLTALLDTGNKLYSTSGAKPVIIADYSAIRTLLSETVDKYLRSNNSQDWLTNLHLCNDETWLARAEIIPYRTVGNSNMLLGFRPDEIYLLSKEGAVPKQEVVIGIYNGKLSWDNTYTALLHPAVVNSIY